MVQHKDSVPVGDALANELITKACAFFKAHMADIGHNLIVALRAVKRNQIKRLFEAS